MFDSVTDQFLLKLAPKQEGGPDYEPHTDLMRFLLPSFILKLTCSLCGGKYYVCVEVKQESC